MRSAEQPEQTAAASGFCLLLCSLWRLLRFKLAARKGVRFSVGTTRRQLNSG